MMSVQRYDIVLCRREAQLVTLETLAAHAACIPRWSSDLSSSG